MNARRRSQETGGSQQVATRPDHGPPFVATLRGRKLSMPVMTIGGQYGVGTKLAEALKDEATHLTSVVASECGLSVAEEVPDFFIEHVQKFLAA